eukprot:COSAG01_NODE_50336_length_364_cov_0.739623_1_plen_68_part_10
MDWDPRPAVCDQAELAALDPANLSFTWEVSEFSADFLDLTVFKGDRWRATGVLARFAEPTCTADEGTL